MKLYKLLFYYTIWSIVILLIHILFPKLFIEEEVNNLIRFVFFISIVLNLYYFYYYSIVDNLKRIPFEILFHILPFYYVTKFMKYDKTKISLIIKLLIVYLLVVDSNTIYLAYKDPLKFINYKS